MSARRTVQGFWLAACVALLALYSPRASAAATCSISAIGPAFGNYDPSSATPRTANGSVTATCTWTGGGPTTVNIVASYSPGNSGSFPNRFMLSGTNQLAYNIYFDTSFSVIRGNGTAGTQTGQATLTVSNANRTRSVTGVLAGRIPAGQNAVPGAYTDTIVITMTY